MTDTDVATQLAKMRGGEVLSRLMDLGASPDDLDALFDLLGGVYSDWQIKLALERDRIVIDPLVTEHIRGSSVDVTLSPYYFRTDRVGGQAYYNPRDPDDVQRYFGQAKIAITYSEWRKLNKGVVLHNIDDDELVISLGPGERILACTEEFIGIRAPGTSEMRARSTTGRNGIVVCKDAGWGDPDYINRWTMEIQNDNREFVILVVGDRIAQIVFHHTGPVERPYSQAGSYQSGNDISAIKKLWAPESMLPKAKRDPRRNI